MSLAASTPLPILLFVAFAAIALAGCGSHIDLDEAARRAANDAVSAVDLTRVETEIGTVGGRVESQAPDAGTNLTENASNSSGTAGIAYAGTA